MLIPYVQTPGVIDATRRSDGVRIAIKCTRNDTQELHIARYLTDHRSPQNHCIPVLDVLQDPLEPHTSLLFMPHLRRFNNPEFGTIDEVMDFIRQSLEVMYVRV